jgi:hypothetical protein
MISKKALGTGEGRFEDEEEGDGARENGGVEVEGIRGKHEQERHRIAQRGEQQIE